VELPALTRSEAIKGLFEVKSANTAAIVAKIGCLLLLSRDIVGDELVSEMVVEDHCRKCWSKVKRVRVGYSISLPRKMTEWYVLNSQGSKRRDKADSE